MVNPAGQQFKENCKTCFDENRHWTLPNFPRSIAPSLRKIKVLYVIRDSCLRSFKGGIGQWPKLNFKISVGYIIRIRGQMGNETDLLSMPL